MIPSDPHPPAHPEALEGSSASKEPHPVWDQSLLLRRVVYAPRRERARFECTEAHTKAYPNSAFPTSPLLTEYCHVNGAF